MGTFLIFNIFGFMGHPTPPSYRGTSAPRAERVKAPSRDALPRTGTTTDERRCGNIDKAHRELTR